jgi:hypothetical protein
VTYCMHLRRFDGGTSHHRFGHAPARDRPCLAGQDEFVGQGQRLNPLQMRPSGVASTTLRRCRVKSVSGSDRRGRGGRSQGRSQGDPFTD